MPQSYDYISLFVSFFDIPVSLGSLFQWIAFINDRPYLSRLNKLFEENEIFRILACHSNYDFLAVYL